jgi:hypothetical protein
VVRFDGSFAAERVHRFTVVSGWFRGFLNRLPGEGGTFA